MRLAPVIFTVVCAYRSVWPRIDVPRICWFDSPLNWVFFGRSAATIAEISWAMQMGLTLRRVGICLGEAGCIPSKAVKRSCWMGNSVIILSVTAECFSWTNLISESDLFSTVEQFLWCVLFLMTGIGLWLLLPSWQKCPVSYKVFIFAIICMGLEQGYESFGLYLPRFVNEHSEGIPLQPVGVGFHKLLACARTTQSIDAWAADAPWMTGYFSIGVWSSIWLAVAPLPTSSIVLVDTSQA